MGLGIRDWDWELGLGISIGDWDKRLELGIQIRVLDCVL